MPATSLTPGMTNSQFEAWVLALLKAIETDRSKRKDLWEDHRVELKGDLPAASKAARQLAGCANSARGEPFAWIFGRPGATLTSPHADWGFQLASEFDAGVFPEVLRWLRFEVRPDEYWLAALFDSSRRPYVLRVAQAQGRKSGGVTLEVPWRHTNGTESMPRRELLLLLEPFAGRPEVVLDQVDAVVREPRNQGDVRWVNVSAKLFASPSGPCSLLTRDCAITIGVEDAEIPMGTLELKDPYGSPNVASAVQSVLRFLGPAEFVVNTRLHDFPGTPLLFRCRLRFGRSEPITIDAPLHRVPIDESKATAYRWAPSMTVPGTVPESPGEES